MAAMNFKIELLMRDPVLYRSMDVYNCYDFQTTMMINNDGLTVNT